MKQNTAKQTKARSKEDHNLAPLGYVDPGVGEHEPTSTQQKQQAPLHYPASDLLPDHSSASRYRAASSFDQSTASAALLTFHSSEGRVPCRLQCIGYGGVCCLGAAPGLDRTCSMSQPDSREDIIRHSVKISIWRKSVPRGRQPEPIDRRVEINFRRR